MDIVDDEFFVTGAGLLWAFNMTQAVNPVTGDKVPIDSMATNSHVILEPSEFQMRFEVRSEEKRDSVVRNFGEVAGGLKVY